MGFLCNLFEVQSCKFLEHRFFRVLIDGYFCSTSCMIRIEEHFQNKLIMVYGVNKYEVSKIQGNPIYFFQVKFFSQMLKKLSKNYFPALFFLLKTGIDIISISLPNPCQNLENNPIHWFFSETYFKILNLLEKKY